MAMRQTLIRSKTRVPAIAERTILRDRVLRAMSAAARGRQILHVVASPGSGKTTAVIQFISARPGQHAWLTLEETDESPGRFVTYLAAAVVSIEREALSRTRDLLAAGISPADCAAILAENLPAGATVVIDDVHHIESRPPALRVFRSFLNAIADGALVIIISRSLGLDLSRSILSGRAERVTGSELAFTTEEIADLLAVWEVSATPSEVAASSGGWAAGIVFDAVRGPRPCAERLLAEDPFFAYLAAEVLDVLRPALRHNVIRSGLLHTVDPRGLESLLDIHSGEAVYAEIRRSILPATLEPEGLRYHPRFREFLLSLLCSEDPDEMRALQARHARQLWADGQVEEAVDQLLAAEEPGEAEQAIEVAAAEVLRRGDGNKVLGWCAALGEEVLARRPVLRGIQIQGLLIVRSGEVTALVEKLTANGEYNRLVREAPDAAVTAAFGLHLTGRWGPLMSRLPSAEACLDAHAMRYLLRVGSGQTPPPEWKAWDLERCLPTVGLLQAGLFFQGRLRDVEDICVRLAGIPAPLRRRLDRYRIAALLQRGRLGDARDAFDAVVPFLVTRGFGEWFWRHLEAELTFAEGEREQGLRMVREARLMAREHGHQVADRAIIAVTEGKMLLRLGMISEAIDSLASMRYWCTERGLPCFREWAGVWLAAALLARGGNPATPIQLLENAISGMTRAERFLELPAAYVLLAEARWRSRDEAGHDAAADAAYRASERLGTLAPLLSAMEDAPDVLTRRIEAESADEDTWKALARTGASARAPSSFSGVRVLIRTLGHACIEIDGAEQDVSPPKAIEIAAAVARAGRRGVSHAALADEFLTSSVDPSSYLRQITHRLRRMLPDGVTLMSDKGRLSWNPQGAVVTEDQVLGSLIARAQREVGEERLQTLSDAIKLAERGPLQLADTVSAGYLHSEMMELVGEARREYAHMLLAAGRSAQAVIIARAATAVEPYREDGWSLLMRAQAAAGGRAAVIPAFAEYARALAEIGLEPSPEISALFERLRARPDVQGLASDIPPTTLN